MVTKVTRDVIDLSIRAITPQSGGLVVEGNAGSDFQISGTVIGLGAGGPADGTFVNLVAINIDSPAIVPVGGVVMFNAAFATLPANWQLCDGTNGTPDMTDQFVYGTNTEGQLLAAGGSADAIVVSHTHTAQPVGNHNHSFTAQQNIGGFTDNGGAPDQRSTAQGRTTGNAGGHTPIIDATGSPGVGANIPPYIKLAFIQRMS